MCSSDLQLGTRYKVFTREGKHVLIKHIRLNEFLRKEVKRNLVRRTWFACAVDVSAVDWQLGGALSP